VPPSPSSQVFDGDGLALLQVQLSASYAFPINRLVAVAIADFNLVVVQRGTFKDRALSRRNQSMHTEHHIAAKTIGTAFLENFVPSHLPDLHQRQSQFIL
jgi:hypothetical protein